MKNFNSIYYRWLFERIEEFIGQKILVVGPAAEKLKAFLGARKNIHLIENDLSDSKNLSLPNTTFDTVVCLNALETSASDSVALQQFHDLLIPDGTAVFLVPALPWISKWLDSAGMVRHRYSKKQIIQKLDQHRFHVTKHFFFNAFGIFFPQHRTDMERNNPLDRLSHFCNDLEKKYCLPLGRSLVVIAKKKLPARG